MITKDHWKEIADDYLASVGAMEQLHALELRYASLEHANILLNKEKSEQFNELLEAKKLADRSTQLFRANVALAERVDAMQKTIDEKQRKIEYQDGHLRTLRQAINNNG